MDGKIIQIEAVQETEIAYGFLFALTEDGKVYATKITETTSPLGVTWSEIQQRVKTKEE